MILESTLFHRLWAGSFVIHLLFFALLFILPSTPGLDTIEIYRVQVVEAPAKPKVKELKLSTGVISELKLESPSLSIESPALTTPELPAPAPPESPAADQPLAAPRTPQAPPVPQPPLVSAEPPPPAPVPPVSGLPDYPMPPPAPASEPGTPRTAELPESAPLAPPPPSAPLPTASSPLERLREKVNTLNMKFETAPPRPAAEGGAPRQSMASFLSLRLYQNKMQEAIKLNYSFPGGFKAGLQVRVRLTIARDGTVLSIEMLDSSGDSQFDYAAQLALRRTQFPPVPDDISGESMTQVITFSP